MSLDPRYHDIVKRCMITAAGIGGAGVFLPVLDMAGIAAIWTGMVVSIANASGNPMSKATVGKVVSAAVSAVSGYYVGSKILTFLAAPLLIAFPVAGVPAVLAVNVMLNGLFTYRLGKTCAADFSRPDFTAEDLGRLVGRIARLLVKVPLPSEVAEVRRLLFN
ncbi:protein of unknown function [Sinosporangium album]|uniref:Uncharacterized protein n=1 Tax=Sinosporangium album TaxID=504805 RepID=A0A1G7YZE8_9ACTN|nr:hypothetical protein [Sinosporangium album]SDH01787.1 protein of unknown function [Sinosporangium album]